MATLDLEGHGVKSLALEGDCRVADVALGAIPTGANQAGYFPVP